MKNIVFTFMDVKNETCPSTKAVFTFPSRVHTITTL
jgi:hypothetical protein